MCAQVKSYGLISLTGLRSTCIKIYILVPIIQTDIFITILNIPAIKLDSRHGLRQ